MEEGEKDPRRRSCANNLCLKRVNIRVGTKYEVVEEEQHDKRGKEETIRMFCRLFCLHCFCCP